MRVKFFSILFTLLFFTTCIIGIAQPLDGAPDPGSGGAKAPISGGIIYLLLMAFGIGIKYFSKKKKND